MCKVSELSERSKEIGRNRTKMESCEDAREMLTLLTKVIEEYENSNDSQERKEAVACAVAGSQIAMVALCESLGIDDEVITDMTCRILDEADYLID